MLWDLRKSATEIGTTSTNILQLARTWIGFPPPVRGDSCMKRALLGTSALLGVGIAVSPALAEEPIRISIGGYYKAAYMGISDDNGVIDDDDDEGAQLGHDTNRDGLFSDAEIHFLGSTVLDNGLEVGVQIEVEGEDHFGDQVDEAYAWFGGGFGELRVGSDDDALHKACVIPPGGS